MSVGMADCLSDSCLLLLFSSFRYFTTVGKLLLLTFHYSEVAFSMCFCLGLYLRFIQCEYAG